MTGKVWTEQGFKEITLPKGYYITSDATASTVEGTDKYTIYYYSNFLGTLYVYRGPNPHATQYALCDYRYKRVCADNNIEELLTNFCTQHKIGLIK